MRPRLHAEINGVILLDLSPSSLSMSPPFAIRSSTWAAVVAVKSVTGAEASDMVFVGARATATMTEKQRRDTRKDNNDLFPQLQNNEMNQKKDRD